VKTFFTAFLLDAEARCYLAETFSQTAHVRTFAQGRSWPPRTSEASSRSPRRQSRSRRESDVWVDWSSVEVFADRGQTVITDQIFPSADGDGLNAFADGTGATLRWLDVLPLRSSWISREDHGHHGDH
jgi:sucrose-6-phosphate hydrolase SacC (GH32 family)